MIIAAFNHGVELAGDISGHLGRGAVTQLLGTTSAPSLAFPFEQDEQD